MENKQKHLEFIQTAINRMASNSFLLKGWAVTLIAALFVLSSKGTISEFIFIAYIPVIIFWILDGYFTSKERLFRDLFESVRKRDDNQIDFSMSTEEFKKNKRNGWGCSMWSAPLWWFYLSLILVMLIIIFLIN